MHWPWQTAEVKKFGRFASKKRTSSNISALIFSSTSPHSPSSTAAENQTRNGNSIRKTIAKWLRLQRPNNSNKSSDVKKQNHGRSRYKLTGMGIKPNLYTYPSTIKSMLMLWHTKLIYLFILTPKSTYHTCFEAKLLAEAIFHSVREVFRKPMGGQSRKIRLLKFHLKVHIFWEGHKFLRNLPLTFDYSTYSQN